MLDGKEVVALILSITAVERRIHVFLSHVLFMLFVIKSMGYNTHVLVIKVMKLKITAKLALLSIIVC
jgi:hypothetical protein